MGLLDVVVHSAILFVDEQLNGAKDQEETGDECRRNGVDEAMRQSIVQPDVEERDVGRTIFHVEVAMFPGFKDNRIQSVKNQQNTI